MESPSNYLGGTGVKAAFASLALRAILLAAIFGGFRSSWDNYLSTSDAGSFISVARVIAGSETIGHLSLYDTRVFPGWPLLLTPGFALGLPAQFALVAMLTCAALAPWLYERLTDDAPGTWLLVAFPPAWLLATLHPVSEAAYFCAVIGGCLALRSRAWFIAGIAAGILVLMRPFGVAWAVAYAAALGTDPHPKRSTALFLSAGALMAVIFCAINLNLYNDVFHQVRVYAQPLAELNVSVPSAGTNAGHWGWPFVHLILTPFAYPVPTWKLIYIVGTVTLFLALAAAALNRLRREAGMPAWQRSLLLGFLLNTLLCFCTGPYWAFYSVDRYLVWGLPGALIAAQPWIRRKPSVVPLLLVAGVAVAAFSIWNRFRVLPPVMTSTLSHAKFTMKDRVCR